MADIFTQITDITKDIIDTRATKVFKTESSRYDTFPPESGFNQIVIRPLSQLISLPMETKRYIFSDAYKDQKKNLNPDTPVRKILDVATEFVTSKYGKSRSKRWRDHMYDLMNQIVRIEGIKGLFSGSRAIIEIEGKNVKEVLKKGCPFNFNDLNKNNSINSTYNGIAFTVDLIDNNPDKVRLFALRSFGESLYHSITDASLEFGYNSI